MTEDAQPAKFDMPDTNRHVERLETPEFVIEVITQYPELPAPPKAPSMPKFEGQELDPAKLMDALTSAVKSPVDDPLEPVRRARLEELNKPERWIRLYRPGHEAEAMEIRGKFPVQTLKHAVGLVEAHGPYYV